MKRVIVSMPDGVCSTLIPFSSITERTFRINPISEFIIAFSILMEQKFFFPAIPVMMKRGFFRVFATIIVP